MSDLDYLGSETHDTQRMESDSLHTWWMPHPQPYRNKLWRLRNDTLAQYLQLYYTGLASNRARRNGMDLVRSMECT